ncbi:MAG: hypothetical protein R3C53_14065 [Pirellulaceae bacterium]
MRNPISIVALRIAIAAVLTCSGTASIVCAQNPFGDPDDTDVFGAPLGGQTDMGVFGTPAPTSTTENTAPAASPLADEKDPVVRLLHLSPPQTAEQWADAFTWMTRIKRWDEVRRLLDQLRSENWNVNRQAALARAGGSAIWLRMRVAEAELTDEQTQLLREILAAPGKLARDTNTIDSWIDGLANSRAAERKMAQFRLQDGGTVAIGRLVDRLLAGDSKVAPAILASTVTTFGKDGEDALRAACLVRDPQRASRVVLAMAALPENRFSVELGGALNSRTLPAESQLQLADILMQKFGRLPDAAAVSAHLEKRFMAALDEYQVRRATAANLDTIVWLPTADGQSIQHIQAPMPQYALERLAQLSAHRMNLRNASRDDMVAASAALLHRAYHRQPNVEAGEIEAGLLSPLDAELVSQVDFWQQVYAQADEWQMHGAALRTIQLIGERASQAEFLAPLDFLSGRLRDARPVIRYAALRAIAKINPQHRYAGAETAVAVALEMSGLGSGPQSLVIGLHGDLRQAAAQLVSAQTGGSVIEANSAEAALLALNGESPIELIFVVDRVSDQSIFELLQRLRKSKYGQSLPIAVLTDQLYQHERQLIERSPSVVTAVLSRDADQMQRVTHAMLKTLDTQPLSVEERTAFARAGGQFLQTIASDRETYAFYPLTDWRERLVNEPGAIPLGGQIQLMAAVGSAEGQRKLIGLAAVSSLREDDRLAAARAFGQSVRRFGLLVDHEELINTYALYNELGPTDPAAARALGYVLDVREAHIGKAEWPEGL